MNKQQILVDTTSGAVAVTRIANTYVVHALSPAGDLTTKTFPAGEQALAWATARHWASIVTARDAAERLVSMAAAIDVHPCTFRVGSEFMPEENHHEPVECGAVNTTMNSQSEPLCPVHMSVYARTGLYSV